MKLTTTVLPIAFLAYFVAASPIEEREIEVTDVQDNSNNNGWGNNGNWYCCKRNNHGNNCVVASCEKSPCSGGGSWSGCDHNRKHCQSCSINHHNNMDWWNSMSHWCNNQGGWWTKDKSNWHNC